jgi:uncharacterized protein (DUF2252 family)
MTTTQHISPRRRGAVSADDHAALGRAARARTRRSAHAGWTPPAEREDPVAVLERQDATRLPELVPIRYGRMLESPFAFFRGSAAVMAADLAATPTSGLRVQLCGDAHLANFGAFASPDRTLVFDINDFDETAPGPFEWDVKRLAASLEIAGRDRGFSKRDRTAAVTEAVSQYRLSMLRFAQMRRLDQWYFRLDERTLGESLLTSENREARARVERSAQKARTKDNLRALERLTTRVDGSLRIAANPPLIVPVEDLVDPDQAGELVDEMGALMSRYARTLSGAARQLMTEYRYVHLARKVVGVGSVGTRAWVVLLIGRDETDPLFLQVKEAQQSVLEPFAGKSRFSSHGRRVVEGQWLMQAATDIFLGWVTATGIDGEQRDFYVRQLWDWKRSAEIETMKPRLLATYGRICGWTLAHGHARAGDAAAIAAYLGASDRFDRAIAAFATAYADQAERDYKALAAAERSGRIEVKRGL